MKWIRDFFHVGVNSSKHFLKIIIKRYFEIIKLIN